MVWSINYIADNIFILKLLTNPLLSDRIFLKQQKKSQMETLNLKFYFLKKVHLIHFMEQVLLKEKKQELKLWRF